MLHTHASYSWYYYHLHQICMVFFINFSRTVVFPILIRHNIHNIQNRHFSVLLNFPEYTQYMHHGCNESVHCCIPRLQSIVVHIASMANTWMPLSHSRYLQCYLKIWYIYDALGSGYATLCNAGYAHGTGDHLRHIVCIVCLDRFSRKKTIGSFKR